ncbi:MAG: O-antigen translocase [Verrucomicrobiota bacterium]
MLIGGASVVNIGLGIVRVKAMAVMLGPAGVGLIGLYGSVADLAQSIAGMGINSSGVRQIAESAGSGEMERVARTATVLRRIAFVLGLVGTVLLVTFSKRVSLVTFGTDQHAHAVALLSIAVFFASISGGQTALVQGMRRIKDLANMSMLGTLFGTAIGIPLIYCFREDGVVPSLIGAAGMTIAASWWYRRKVPVRPVSMSFREMRAEAATLLKLGFAFMTCGLLTLGSAYAIRTLIANMSGLHSAGLYQSAWTLGGLYVGFILQAMGTDFYPRLSAIATDDSACNRLVNEQAQISLLMAGPGVMATLTFAPIVIALFYSGEFVAAVAPLRWICLGLMLRVVAWPMGFILLAKKAQTLFILTELAAATVHVGLAWTCIHRFGLTGAGAAFFGLYAWHTSFIYFIVHRLTGFRWSAQNRQSGALVLSLVWMVFCGFLVFPFWIATTLGTIATSLLGIYSLRRLLMLIPGDGIPKPIRRLVVALRLAPASAQL